MNYMLERLREPSTWRGIVMLVTALGVSLTPDQQSAIMQAGLAIVGLIGVFAPEPRNDQSITVNLHPKEGDKS